MTTISRRTFLSTSAASVVLSGADLCLADDADSPPNDNPFLSENFAPVHEEVAVDELHVIGKLPPELNGMFIRNGPNPQFPPILNYHMFDGDGMLHGVRIQDGKASYRNRWVRTAAWQKSNKAGKAIYPSVLDPPDAKYLMQQLLNGELPYPNPANTALLWHHGKLLALWGGGVPHEVNVPSLETVGRYSFGATLKHAFTAHPKIDPKTGELMFFGYSPVPPFLQYSVADRAGRIKSTTPIDLPRPVLMHDMAITEHYSLFIDCPAVIDLTATLRGKPLLNFEPERGARIGVQPRHASGDKITWFAIEPCFIFHIFNAYEDGDQIVLHGCRFPSFPDLASFDGSAQIRFKESVEEFSPIAHAWQIDMKTRKVTESSLDELTSEFPRVNENFTGAKARYGYSVSSTWESAVFLKYDFERGTREVHALGKDHHGGEGIFVERSDAKSEDDGWLISFTHDRAEGQSELRVVDCRNMTADPIARIQIPQRVPFGFHGIWLPGNVL